MAVLSTLLALKIRCATLRIHSTFDFLDEMPLNEGDVRKLSRYYWCYFFVGRKVMSRRRWIKIFALLC